MADDKRYVCLHGHFYQPPRENPWLEDIEVQESASPYHDWNERITHECYSANATSRILDEKGWIRRIVNNYSKISFNFGPTLLYWMDLHAPALVDAIVEADRESRERFSGHGSAIAQAHSHMIMPLANTRDKKTQILWGLSDFRSRFGREPEGMWLPETAADLETLDIMAGQGLSFVILAPRQARRVRKMSSGEWRLANEKSFDTTVPYLCRLPSGKSICVFFYHGALAQELAFGDLLKDGKAFAQKMCSEFRPDRRNAQLIHIATDGETYGHHHRFGDMALAYALDYIEENNLAKLTVYGEYLEKYPPSDEVEIHEYSSWSCFHGVERWRSDCGCHVGGGSGWNQQWRTPLRNAMDQLSEGLADVFEKEGRNVFKNPWLARDEYEPVVRNRNQAKEFLDRHMLEEMKREDVFIKALKLLEMQRYGLLMYASCGWFFDDITGLEPIQIMRCACRAMQLAQEVSGVCLEPGYLKILESARPNEGQFDSGADVYRKQVKPMEADLLKIGAFHAVESLFDDAINSREDYHCFVIETGSFQRLESGRLVFSSGIARVVSNITRDAQQLYYCALNLGDHNVMAGVDALADSREEHGNGFNGKEVNAKEPAKVIQHVRTSFEEADVLETIKRIQEHFKGRTYDTADLFEEARRRVQLKLLDNAQAMLKNRLGPIFKEYSHTLKVARKDRSVLPKVLKATLEMMLNSDLEEALTSEDIDVLEISLLHDEAVRWSMTWDSDNTRRAATKAADCLAGKLKNDPLNLKILTKMESFLDMAAEMKLQPDLWECQNEVYAVSEQHLDEMRRKTQKGDPEAEKWIKTMGTLCRLLKLTYGSLLSNPGVGEPA